MRLLFISLFISTLCFGQGKSKLLPTTSGGNHTGNIVGDLDSVVLADSMSIKVVSMKELESYLQRISIVAMKQFDLTEKAKYDNIFKELQAIYLEADKKRKQK